jgi:aerobic carbon-monoxide dehydrogenase medium subunit
MKSFEFLTPETVEQACAHLAQYQEEAKVIAGGQSLVIMLKHGLLEPSYVINLQSLPGLDTVSFNEKEGLRMGALVTHRTVETSPIIRKQFDVLSKAEETLATIQIRNYGTVGGNLCQADPSSDLISPLIALDAKVKVTGLEQERVIPLEEFFVDYYETVLKGDEIVTEIQVPVVAKGSVAVYRKISLRKTDSPMVGCAIRLTLDSERKVCREARLVLSAAGPVPLRIKRAEEMMEGEAIQTPLIDEVAHMASEESDPIPDVHASGDYKRDMVKVLVSRLLTSIARRS